MKLIKLLTLSILTSTFLIACGSKEEKKDESKDSEKTEETEDKGATSLEGAWEIKRATGDMADLSVGVVYTFEGENLSLSYNKGKTIITDKTFSFQAEGTELVFTYDYKFEGDTLIVSLQNSGQTFYLVKQ